MAGAFPLAFLSVLYLTNSRSEARVHKNQNLTETREQANSILDVAAVCQLPESAWPVLMLRKPAGQLLQPAHRNSHLLTTMAVVWDRWATLLEVDLLQCPCLLRALSNMLERGRGGDINLKPSYLILCRPAHLSY